MEKLVKYLYWLRIFISPFLFGLVMAVLAYLNWSEEEEILGIFAAILCVILGTSAGLWFAHSMTQKHGAENFSAKHMDSTVQQEKNTTKD